MKNIRANIWANRIEGGAVIYNTTIDRLWKEDDETDGSGRVVKTASVDDKCDHVFSSSTSGHRNRRCLGSPPGGRPSAS
jgi:hypothetical protein